MLLRSEAKLYNLIQLALALQVNAVHAGILMAGSADGAVRVWRDYTFRGTQRLATAWQVCSQRGAARSYSLWGHMALLCDGRLTKTRKIAGKARTRLANAGPVPG